MKCCLCNIEPNTMWTKKIIKLYAENKNKADVRGENTNDEEVARLVRAGFDVSYSGMFGMYRARWNRV